MSFTSKAAATAGVALSEMVGAEHLGQRHHATSPEPLVNRKALLERIGMEEEVAARAQQR